MTRFTVEARRNDSAVIDTRSGLVAAITADADEANALAALLNDGTLLPGPFGRADYR